MFDAAGHKVPAAPTDLWQPGRTSDLIQVKEFGKMPIGVAEIAWVAVEGPIRLHPAVLSAIGALHRAEADAVVL